MKSVSRRTLFGLPIPFLATASMEAAGAPTARPTTPAMWNETQLYFGRSMPNGLEVTEEQFASFVDIYVTPRFPDGLTLLSGYGQFKNSADTIVKEQSKVLIILYPPGGKQADTRIDQIRESYKALFLQESVLRVDGNRAVSF
jgi:hypothetical protein